MKQSFLFFFLLLAHLFLFVAETNAGTDQPNIVFVLIDDLRSDMFGYQGHPFIETPAIDRLATEGIQFTNAFVTTSLCSPSRASFMTGMYMHHHHVVDNNNLMKKGTVIFPQLLQKAGYQTAFIGKWHMGGASDEPREGFDHWVSFRGQGTYFPNKNKMNVNGKRVPRKKYMTDELTDYAEEWLEKQDGKKPFLLYLSHKGIHGPYRPAPRHLDQFKNQKITLPDSMSDTPGNYAGKPMWVKNQRNSWHGVDHPYHSRHKQTIGEMKKHYCEMLISIDESVKRVMKTLKTNGLDKNTIVIFTSDGGFLWGEHGLIDKRCAYEESVHIPFLVWAPKLFDSKREVKQMVANIDVAPTLLELAGVSAPGSMDGISFAQYLKNKEEIKPIRKSLLYEYYWEYNFPQTPTTFALRNQRYKLIQYHGVWDSDELYDLQKDPEEMENLIRKPSHQKLVKSMRLELYEQLKQSGGLSVKFGYKRSAGSNRRNKDGSKASRFPEHFYRKKQK
jgi:arylsulfatase A-like enzyme